MNKNLLVLILSIIGLVAYPVYERSSRIFENYKQKQTVKKTLQKYELAVTNIEQLEADFRESGGYSKEKEIDEIYCNLTEVYIKNGEFEKARSCLIDRAKLISGRKSSRGNSGCISELQDKIVDYYFGKKEFDKVAEFLEVCVGSYKVVDLYVNKIKDKTKAVRYLEQKIESETNPETLEWIMKSLGYLSENYTDYKKWLVKSFAQKRDNNDSSSEFIHYLEIGEASKAVAAYDRCKECKSDNYYIEKYNFLMKYKNEPPEVLATLQWYNHAKGNDSSIMLNRIVDKYPKTKLKAEIVSILFSEADAKKDIQEMERLKELKKYMDIENIGLNKNKPQSSVELNNFIELNKSDGIFYSSGIVYFKTGNNYRLLNIKNREWEYVISDREIPETNKMMEWCFVGRDPDRTQLAIPEWIPESVYSEVVSVDNYLKPKYMIVRNADEGAVWNREYFIDIENKKYFIFGYEDLWKFVVVDNIAWILSCSSIVSLNLLDGSRTDYITIPITNLINAYVTIGDNFYYNTKKLGLYKINSSGEIEMIEAVNKKCRKNGSTLLTMKRQGDILFLLGVKMDETGGYLKNADNTVNLFIYDASVDKLKEIPVAVSYADEIIINDNYLIGYGYNQEYYEGGDSSYFGGFFVYNINADKVIITSKYPVQQIELADQQVFAKSVFVDEYSNLIDYYKYSYKLGSGHFNLIDQKHVSNPEDNNFDTTSGIWKQAIPVNLTVTTEYKGNADEYNRLQEIYKKYQNDREVNIINTYREVLKNKVKIKTIAIQRDSVKIKKH